MWLNPSTAVASPAHARWLENEFDALTGFASEAATDYGFGYLDSHGQVLPERGHELYLTCRMIHIFTLAHLLGRPGAATQAAHGIAALAGPFRDPRHPGWFTALDSDGAVTDDSKSAYAHAFVILALASATTAQLPRASELLGEALHVSQQLFWDDAEGMVIDSFNRSFGRSEPYRGMNANMHTVEAYLAAADVAGEQVWLERALRITERALDGFARAHEWRLPEHYTPTWEPILDYRPATATDPFRPAGSTIGHWFEWARLALSLEAALLAHGRPAPAFLAEVAIKLFAAAVEDGWSVDGEDGFVYTVDFSGAPLVRQRMHWVVAEALGAAAALYQRTGEEKYERWYRLWWEYAAVHFIDPEGSWFHELTPTHDLDQSVWEGKPDIYHAAQATLIPRVALTPVLAKAIATGLLDEAVLDTGGGSRGRGP